MASKSRGEVTSPGERDSDNESVGNTGEAEQGGTLSRDEMFELLSNHRRRFTLHHLHENGDSADLGEIAEHVAAWENDIEVQAVSSTERKRTYTSLQQFHLPKMDDKGIIEYDDREGVVELAPAAEEMDIYLEVVEGHDITWSQYYLALAAVNLALIVAAQAGTYPIRLVPTASWAIFVVTTFLLSAVVHTYLSRTEMRLGDTETPPEVVG